MLNHAIYFGLYEYLMICLQFRFSLMLQTFHVKIMQARKIHFSVFVKSAILFLVNLKNSNQSKNTNGSYMSFSACLWWLIPCRCTKEVWRTTSIIFTTHRTLLAAIFRNQESWWSWVIGVTQLRQDGEAFFILCFNLNW